MGYIQYTKALAAGTYDITAASKIVKISLLNKGPGVATYEGDSAVPPPAGLPAGGPIDIAVGEKFADTATDSGYIQKATITVPVGGLVTMTAEYNL